MNDKRLRTRVNNSTFERVARHVFRIQGAARCWEQDLLIAVYAGGDRCVASHRAAAAVHRFDGFRRCIIEVTVPRGVRYRREGVIVHESLDLAPCDCTSVGPIPTTTPERTLIDLGAVAIVDRVEEALDSADRELPDATSAVARRHAQVRRQGRNGVGPMAVVLDRRPVVTPASVLERRFLRLLERASLPAPTCQFPLLLRSGRTVYLDAAYPELLVGFEIDGHRWHASRQQRAADNARAGAIEDLGWQLRRFTYEQIVNEGPSVVRAVKSARAARSCDT